MVNSPMTAIVGITGGLLAAVAFFTADSKLAVRSLSLTSLTYENGLVTQAHKASPSGIKAQWTASMRDPLGALVCAPATGPGHYFDREPGTMPIDVWIGPGCEAKLKCGLSYEGFASWEYTGEEGTRITISGRVPFTYKGSASRACP